MRNLTAIANRVARKMSPAEFEEVRAFLEREGIDDIIYKLNNLQVSIFEYQEKIDKAQKMLDAVRKREVALTLKMESKFGWTEQEYEDALSEAAGRGISMWKEALR